MFFRTYSATLIGVNSRIIEVEVDYKKGLPNNTIVGLPDPAIREAKERVNAAVRNSGFEFPIGRLTVNLAPAQIRKEGTSFDVAIAIGILLVSKQISCKIDVSRLLLVGELALDGMIRPIKGIIAVAQEIKRTGFLNLVLPEANLKEASLVPGVNLIPVRHLKEATEVFVSNDLLMSKARNYKFGYKTNGKSVYLKTSPERSIDDGKDLKPKRSIGDYSEVVGQEYVKRAALICAAGGHNMLLIGSPGSGKTMVASRLPTILPDLSEEESIETTKIYSISGMLPEGFGLIRKRPFRAPHSTASNAAIIGGGKNPIPGEVTLAHNGILFLDEFPEFSRNIIQALRQPVESGSITISRADMRVTFPARFILVGSMNPCPCGYLFDPENECHCLPQKIKQYYMKLSAPILDRFDLQAIVNPLKPDSMVTPSKGLDSDSMLEMVLKARQMQYLRYERNGNGLLNANMSPENVEKYCPVNNKIKKILRQAARTYKLSMRGIQKILKVARTISDIKEKENIVEDDILEALSYRGVAQVLSGCFNKIAKLNNHSY